MNRRTFAIHSGLPCAALLLPPAVAASGKREDEEKVGHTVDNLIMFSIAVTDMPKARAFYSDLKVTTDSRLDDHKVKNDLYGPGSGVKWFNLQDPDGNQVLLVQSGGKYPPR
jgi:catechol 2,3-dioxygenase-like lactoylglutathione lyase family enzyme